MAQQGPHDFKAFMARTLETQPAGPSHPAGPAAPGGPVVHGGHVSMMVRGNVYFVGDVPDTALAILLGRPGGLAEPSPRN